MRLISLFDVIGPNMIGPSSSHTAGALRIARMAQRIADAPIRKVTFVLYGSFARTYLGHGTDRALVGGILGFDPEDRRIRESFKCAREAGVEFDFRTNTTDTDVHPNTVRIIAEDINGRDYNIVGESIGGGNARLREINGFHVDISGELPTLLISSVDEKGVLARITEIVSDAGVNIAFMNLCRESKLEPAVIVIEADGEIPDNLLEVLRSQDIVSRVILIKV